MSRFVGLNKEFVRYLDDLGVTWHIAVKTGQIRERNLIKVLTVDGAEIVRNAFEVEDFIAHDDFGEELEELGYRYTRRYLSPPICWYRVFNRAQMMDLLLRFEWTKPHGFVRFDK